MDKALLITKLNKCEDTNNVLYNCYSNAFQNNYESLSEEFDQHIADLKTISEIMYDFDSLTTESAKFGISRRDYRELCDMVCTIIGDRINEICKQSKEPIITKPSKFEDYCPFTSDDMVVYGNIDRLFKYDGEIYRVVESKLEETPYYIVYCNSIERI